MFNLCRLKTVIWLVLSTLLVLAQVTFLLKLVVHAAPPPLAWRAWASDAPIIDGFLSPMSVVAEHVHRAEWEDADTGDIWLWWDGANHKCTLYVMNDDVNLYIALEISAEDYDDNDFLWLNFDDDHDHEKAAGEDVIMHYCRDSNVDTYAGTFSDQFWVTADEWPDPWGDGMEAGGSGDGVGACKFTGAESSGTYVFELAHPLNSGDDYDFSLQAGDTVGFNWLYYDSTGGWVGWPEFTKQDWALMTDIEIAHNPSIVGDVPPLNLRISQFEVTQAIQWLNDPGQEDNSVRLARGKSTVVRVYVDVELSGVSIPNVEVFLHATNFGETRAKPVLVGAKAARANGPLRESFTAPRTPTRGNVRHTANFLLPDYWVEIPPGDLTLLAFVRAPAGRSETNYSDNWSNETFWFELTKPLKIGYCLIDYRPTAPGDSENLPGDVSMYHHRLYEKIYPTPDLSDPTEYIPLGTFSWSTNLKLPNGNRSKTAEVDLLKTLRFMYLWWNVFFMDPDLDQLVGWIPANSLLGIGGRAGAGAPLADGRKVVTFIKYPNWGSLPHEIGHNLRGPHAWNDSENPWLGDDLPPTENETQTYGFDTWRPFRVYGPTSGELMSYDSPRWISPWQWTLLLEILDPPAGFSASQDDVQMQTQGSSPSLWVSGTIRKNQTSWLDPVFQVSSFLGTTTPTGPYAVELRGAPPAEPLLYSQSFDVSFEDCHEGFIDVSSFMVELPFMTGTYSVSLWNTSISPPILLDKITASSSPPQVTVTYPNGGETVGDSFTATWTGTDIDGDPLTYILLYSSDSGTTWRPLATHVQGTSYRVNASLLPGGSQSLIRVVASDGFHTSEDQSDTAFYVPLKGPLNVVGNSGSNVTIFREPVLFRGSAFDPEDGLLQDSALSWRSDLDGALGTGKVLGVADLSPGIHNITLTATDSHGNNATDSFTVTVKLHNIKVAEVTADPVSIYEGQPVDINVNVILKNEGTEAEGFNVHAYLVSEDPSTPDLSLWNQSVTGLPSNSNMTFAFSWNTTGSVAGNYTIICLAEPVPSELYAGDNYLATHVHVKIVGDINGDRKVDIKDIAFIAIRYGAIEGDLKYDPLADITGVKYLVPDAKIDIRDIALAAKHYGELG